MFVSPYQTIEGLVWFPRMLEKIRLRAKGKLPEDYHSYMGRGFDARCVDFLQVSYEALVEKLAEGGTDCEILEWCFQTGRRPSETEILIWNEFMVKRGWRDTDASPDELQIYKEKFALGHRSDIVTYFDFFEVDEGRRE